MYPYVLLEGLCNVSSVGSCQIGAVMLMYVEVDSADHFNLGAQFSSDFLGPPYLPFCAFESVIVVF